jgi:hypothetical protein
VGRHDARGARADLDDRTAEHAGNHVGWGLAHYDAGDYAATEG